MNINFPAVDDTYIKAKVSEGYYSNATELIRDAVRRLRETDDVKYSRLLAAIELGEDSIRQGRTRKYSPELLLEIGQDAYRNASDGKVISPDVCPSDAY